MNLPPLPDTSWVDIPHFTYTSKDMLAYGKACAAAALVDETCAALAQQTVSGAPDPVGIPAGEQTGPVLGAPTSQRADEPVAPIAMVKVYGCYDAAQIPLEVRGVYQIDGFTTGVYVNMPSGACAPFAPAAPASQRADEPVATVVRVMNPDKTTSIVIKPHAGVDLEPLVRCSLYTAAPAAPAYVPLSDDEIWQSDAIMDCNAHIGAPKRELLRLVCAIESLVVARMRGEGK